jgi:hypothetical protein
MRYAGPVARRPIRFQAFPVNSDRAPGSPTSASRVCEQNLGLQVRRLHRRMGMYDGIRRASYHLFFPIPDLSRRGSLQRGDTSESSGLRPQLLLLEAQRVSQLVVMRLAIVHVLDRSATGPHAAP